MLKSIPDPEMIRFIPDHLKTKKMCKNAFKKLPFVIKLLLINIKLNKCVTLL